MLIMLALFDYLARTLDQFAGLKLAEVLIRCTTETLWTLHCRKCQLT
jgi:hypothetical protein